MGKRRLKVFKGNTSVFGVQCGFMDLAKKIQELQCSRHLPKVKHSMKITIFCKGKHTHTHLPNIIYSVFFPNVFFFKKHLWQEANLRQLEKTGERSVQRDE